MATNVVNIARNGRAARLITEAMERHGYTNGTLARAVGVDTSMVSYWTKARRCPNKTTRPKLAKLLKLNEADLVPADGTAIATRAQVLPAISTAATPRPGRSPLTFQLTPEGRARITLDLDLPADRGAKLLRVLLDLDELVGTPE